jgi:hypothetical protein
MCGARPWARPHLVKQRLQVGLGVLLGHPPDKEAEKVVEVRRRVLGRGVLLGRRGQRACQGGHRRRGGGAAGGLLPGAR